jgi:hypothetical protein
MSKYIIGGMLGLALGITMGCVILVWNDHEDKAFYAPFEGKVCMSEEWLEKLNLTRGRPEAK